MTMLPPVHLDQPDVILEHEHGNSRNDPTLRRISGTMETQVENAKSMAQRISDKISAEAARGKRISPAEALQAIRLDDKNFESMSDPSDADPDARPDGFFPNWLTRKWREQRAHAIATGLIQSAKPAGRPVSLLPLLLQRIEIEKAAGRTMSPAEAMAAIKSEDRTRIPSH